MSPIGKFSFVIVMPCYWQYNHILCYNFKKYIFVLSIKGFNLCFCLSVFVSFFLSLFLSLCFRFQVMLCQYDLLLIRTAIIYITKCFLTCPCILIGFHVDFFVCVFLFCILLLLNVYSSN